MARPVSSTTTDTGEVAVAAAATRSAARVTQGSTAGRALLGRRPVVCSALAYIGDAYMGEAYIGEAYIGDAYIGDAYIGDAYIGDAYIGDAYMGFACTAAPPLVRAWWGP